MKMTLILSAAVCVLSLQCQARAQQTLREKLTMSNGTRGQESSSAAARHLDEQTNGLRKGEVKQTNAVLCSEVKARDHFNTQWYKPSRVTLAVPSTVLIAWIAWIA
jgi:hypothetical protein